MIGQFCVFEWPPPNNRSFESTDSTNGFRDTKKAVRPDLQTHRPDGAIARLVALRDSGNRDRRCCLLYPHLFHPLSLLLRLEEEV